MIAVATTKLSSKGQVVIPEALRHRMKLKAGAEFVVVGDGDVVILKTLKAPFMDEFDDLIKQARSQAKLAGMKKHDVASAIAKVRAIR